MAATIRFCSPEDLPVVAEIGRSFFEEGKLPGKLVPEVFETTWTALLTAGAGGILMLEDSGDPRGVLGFLQYPDINDGETVITETFWYVLPQHRRDGLKLLRRFESVAKERGAKRIIMGHLKALTPETLGHLYTRLGYTELETTYIKAV